MIVNTLSLVLLFWIALGLLGVLLVCLLAFLVIRTAILGALKAHTNWIDRGKP